VIRLQNIGNAAFNDAYAHISEKHYQSLLKHRVEAGDIIIAALGETLPRSCLIPFWIGPAIVKADCIKFRPDHRLAIPEYLNFALNTDATRHRTCAIIHGVGRPRLNLGEIKSIFLPVAPLIEQCRIVQKIEELFSKLDAGVAALERVKAGLKRYRAAVLKAAVEGKLTADWRAKHPATEPASQLLQRILQERRRKWEQDQLAKYAAAGKEPPRGWQAKYKEPTDQNTKERPQLPEGWCWATVEQVNPAERPISYGVLQPGDALPNGVLLVRVCDIADGKVAIDQMKKIHPDISGQYQRTLLKGGEVLLTVVGTIGRTAVAPKLLLGANTARAVAVIAILPPIDPHFIEFTLRESTMRAKLTKAAHEVARKTLNLEDVRIACLPIPPLAEQQQIVAEVERRLSIVDELEAQVEANLKRAGRLRQSILKRAFEGRLVPQDPSDEPADELLKRISAARSTNEKRKNANGPKRTNFLAGKRKAR
jgi:type I restriction enzyme S subunit